MLHTVFVAKYVRMAPYHLPGDRLDDIAEVEMIFFLGHACVIDHLQQQIPEFFAQLAHVAVVDRFGHLIGFLDRVGGNGGKVLLQIPGAAGHGRPQSGHDFDQAGYVAAWFH